MGHYIDTADIQARHTDADLVALTDDEGTGSLDATRVAAAIQDAEGEVDAILAQGGLAVPMSPIPDRLITLTVAVAWWYLCARRRPIPQSVQDAYDQAKKDLVQVARTGATGGVDEPPMLTTRKPRRGAPDRRFTDDTMTGF